MTREEAIRILDPKTTCEALAEIEYYNGFSGKTAAVQAVSDACVLAVAAIREQEERENRKGVDFDAVNNWIPVTERLPSDDRDVLIVASGNPVKNVRLENSLEIACFSKDDGWILVSWPDWETAMVSHWMPLPEPPNEENI